jgi:copper(I)-binding protein
MKFSHKLLRVFFTLFLLPCAFFARAELLVENAWVKLAPPSIQMSAAYMKLSNQQQTAQVITNVSADCCVTAMLHHTKAQGDKVVMDHLDKLAIPAQSSIQLLPGDLHIMLMGARYPLVLDTPIRITFTFSDGSRQDIDTIVKKDGH